MFRVSTPSVILFILSIILLVLSDFSASSAISTAQLTQKDTAKTAIKPPSSPTRDKDTPLDDTTFNWSNFKVRTAHSIGAGCLYSMRMWRSRRAASLVHSQYNMPY
ncbi:hypothetical protein BDY19DRAFT_951497 [Irpex rosettiformis]|uniref:Uncharacterized protein n=1 Tax=Irpex rosettiformis TaxID=378272 RepID=A0ACB8U0X8_9APHY|nr:hypothetical protein BDY19DRAFT_951497 [Irpex rosettiformis]